MTNSVQLPFWLAVIIFIFALWALLDRLLLPSIRWYFKRKANIIIEKVSKKLQLRLPDFKLTKRQVLIDRLIFDPKVLEGVETFCQEHNAPREVALEKVKRYAREIVPAFNAYVYFRLGNWIGKSVVRLLYRVRLGFTDEAGLTKIDPHSSVVFIMNHRSNMDSLLLAYLAFKRAALSFAVGEWARVWPLQQMIRAMGGFFVRRGSGNLLYRCVLARYVQMATESGVVQAAFLEGKMSQDGRLNPSKLGLLEYMLRSFNPNEGRDLVFIPVGVNYDRVLEDRSLLLSVDPKANKPSQSKVIKTTVGFLFHNLLLMLRGGWHRFGYAVANFGTPISMREYSKTHKIVFKDLDKNIRIEKIKKLSSALMVSIGSAVPVVPVSLIANVFASHPQKAFSDLELKAQVQKLLDKLEQTGAHIYIPRKDRNYAIEVGLRMLTLRHIVLEENDLYRAAPEENKILDFYANSIEHLMSPGSNNKL